MADPRGSAMTGTTPTGTPPRCCPPGGGFRCLAGFSGCRHSTQPSISTTRTPGVSQAAKPASTHHHWLIPTPSGKTQPGHGLVPSTHHTSNHASPLQPNPLPPLCHALVPRPGPHRPAVFNAPQTPPTSSSSTWQKQRPVIPPFARPGSAGIRTAPRETSPSGSHDCLGRCRHGGSAPETLRHCRHPEAALGAGPAITECQQYR
jgi:hypothetical protein